VNCLPDPQDPPPNTTIIHFPCSEWIPFEEIVAYIAEAEKPVLVYCIDGVNISPAICAAYFARKKSVPGQVALAYVM
jgi:hypothetical protein